eukprot:4374434-Amphidinium_carterae.1
MHPEDEYSQNRGSIESVKCACCLKKYGLSLLSRSGHMQLDTCKGQGNHRLLRGYVCETQNPSNPKQRKIGCLGFGSFGQRYLQPDWSSKHDQVKWRLMVASCYRRMGAYPQARHACAFATSGAQVPSLDL